MGRYPNWLSKPHQEERDKRIVFLRDESHLVSGGEPLTWQAICDRMELSREAVRKAYKRGKKNDIKRTF